MSGERSAKNKECNASSSFVLLTSHFNHGSFGEARAYVILRRMQSATGFSPWLDASISIATQASLSNQPQRIQLEFRVVAMNAAGTSVPSNSVAAVL